MSNKNYSKKFINPKEFAKECFIYDEISPASEMRFNRKKNSPKKNKQLKSEK